uniref:Uncharacterized protein n=1 Tax=Cacopsylla melanoneura TaxID=428564 RepID=A0A8D9DMR8_9HEMI
MHRIILLNKERKNKVFKQIIPDRFSSREEAPSIILLDAKIRFNILRLHCQVIWTEKSLYVQLGFYILPGAAHFSKKCRPMNEIFFEKHQYERKFRNIVQ